MNLNSCKTDEMTNETGNFNQMYSGRLGSQKQQNLFTFDEGAISTEDAETTNKRNLFKSDKIIIDSDVREAEKVVRSRRSNSSNSRDNNRQNKNRIGSKERDSKHSKIINPK